MSDDGRTVFALVYPRPDPESAFGENPKAEKAASAALKDATIAGQPVHLTGFDALAEDSGGDGNGPGVFLEALLGGLGFCSCSRSCSPRCWPLSPCSWRSSQS